VGLTTSLATVGDRLGGVRSRRHGASKRSGAASAYGQPGWGAGGGLSIASADPPLADLDTYTESNTINNAADIYPNISGPYSLNGTWALRWPSVTYQDWKATAARVLVFTVSLSAPSSQAASVSYATADAGAEAGSDYQAASGTLTIPAGQTTGMITVLVNGDRLAEANETFFVNLSSPANAIVGDGRGIGTVLDDEARISINDVTVTEGNAGTVNATFTVSLSLAYDSAVTFLYQTASRTATAGSDYDTASGDVTIAAGQTTTTIPVAVIGDRSAEFTEDFVVILSNSTNATFVGGGGAWAPSWTMSRASASAT
jgi:hypothetical protein